MVCIFLTPFFTTVYIVERLELQTIYVLNKKILQFLGLKSADYNREQFQIKSGLYWRKYGIQNFAIHISKSFMHQ